MQDINKHLPLDLINHEKYLKLLQTPIEHYDEQVDSPIGYASPIGKYKESKDDLNRFLIHLGFTHYASYMERGILYSMDQTYINKMLKNVDKSYGKETTKVGLFRIPNTANVGTNSGDVAKYNAFASSLGSVVDLQSYNGYTGGLEVDDRCRVINTVNMEIVVHDAELLMKKGAAYVKRHIGNDVIHVVYDEGVVPYTPWEQSGDFGDVVIVVRAFEQYSQVTVYKKKNIPNIGPLEGTNIVPNDLIGKLVTSTIILATTRMNSKTWIESKQEKLYPHKNREACIGYYREKFFGDSKIEQLANSLLLSSWQ